MPELDALDPHLSTAILTLGIVLIAGAIVGGGLEAAGTKLPVIAGWRRQLVTAAFGVALVGLGWYALQAARWYGDYMALVNGMNAHPPFPPQTVEDNLNLLADSAASSYSRNCKIAYFIYDHNVDIPAAVRLQLQGAQHTGSGALQCYIDVERLAAEKLTATSAQRPAASAVAHPPFVGSPPQAQPSPAVRSAERILEVVTPEGATGWIWLGRNAAPGRLQSDRTVIEDAPAAGQSLTTSTAAHLRDPAATSSFSEAKVVGVIPKGSTVAVVELRGSNGTNTWARVRVAHEPPK
ncbi:MAG: hypothetical protein JOZ24_06540 [Candidatus Eremiobacteraeota bacterium]|nr:hypothetical protein [Candidatus Eremiobacteraeota bacterium]